MSTSQMVKTKFRHGLCLYHLSPRENDAHIAAHGLLVATATSGVPRVWLCELCEVDRIAKHLNVHHKRSVCIYTLYSVQWWLVGEVKKHGSPGVYWMTTDVPPWCVHATSEVYSEQWDRSKIDPHQLA